MFQLTNCTAPICQVVHFIMLRIISSALGLWSVSEFNISLSHSLNEWLIARVTYQVRKLKISVHRNFKYVMTHPWEND